MSVQLLLLIILFSITNSQENGRKKIICQCTFVPLPHAVPYQSVMCGSGTCNYQSQYAEYGCFLIDQSIHYI